MGTDERRALERWRHPLVGIALQAAVLPLLGAIVWLVNRYV